jgi:hypothetical protein
MRVAVSKTSVIGCGFEKNTMQIEKLNQWLMLVANLGVVAGIVFLAIEIQQNTAVTQSSVEQEITSSRIDFAMRIAENEDFAASLFRMRESPEQATQEDVYRYESLIAAVFLLAEGAYRQYKLGFLPAEGWEPYQELLKTYMRNGIARNWWITDTYVFSPDFQEAVIELTGVERAANRRPF